MGNELENDSAMVIMMKLNLESFGVVDGAGYAVKIMFQVTQIVRFRTA